MFNNIFKENGPSDEAAHRIPQENNLIRSVPPIKVKIWPVYCMQHGSIDNIEPKPKDCGIIPKKKRKKEKLIILKYSDRKNPYN